MRTLSFATMLLAAAATAQNLVPNPSFEDYTTCPSNIGYWVNIVDWSAAFGSPDYFNSCHTGASAGVPHNSCGYQHPAHGSAYLGIITFNNNNPLTRELTCAQLIMPLQVGVPVHLSFKVAMGGGGTWNGGSAIYTCLGVGMKFFVDMPSLWYDYLYPNSAAIWLDQVPTDTAIWYTVSGQYIPDSAYTHLVIGNFFENGMSAPFQFDTTGFGNFPGAYVFVDEVCVSHNPADCGIIVNAMEQFIYASLVSNNPFSDRLQITLPGMPRGQVDVVMYDISGKLAHRWVLHDQGQVIMLDTSSLSDGIYLLNLIDAKGSYGASRVVHVSP